MKNRRILCGILLGFMLICNMGEHVHAQESVARGGIDAGYGRAAYATKRPQIDGKTDDVWNTTEALYSEEGEGKAHGYVKVLWTEDTLYFLAKIDDPSLAVSSADSICNCINFWVSETVSQKTGYNQPGDWCLAVNADGDVRCPVGNRAVLDKVTCSVQKETDLYTVEFAMPVLTEGLTYSEQDGIGFNISIDDEVDGDNVRDGFRSWQKYSNDVWYWENTEDLAVVQFVQQIDDLQDVQADDIEANAADKDETAERIETWQIVVGISGVVVLCVGIVIAIIIIRRRRKGTSDELK